MIAKPRTFEHFPKNVKCPICGTSEDAECVLLGIDGTGNDNIEEATPVHLWCAVATRHEKQYRIIYRRVGP